MKRLLTTTFVIWAGCAANAYGQTQNNSAEIVQQLKELKNELSTLKEIVTAQQKTIAQLQGRQVVDSKSLSSTPLPTSQTVQLASTIPAQIRPSGTYVPDIGVVADIVGTETKSNGDENGNNRLSLRELELVFGHDIDPYSTLNVVATLSDQEDPDIEEANVTYWGLPYGIKAKVGRMRERIGKASSTHRDALETVDEPLVIQHYFGSEGLFKTGAELSAFTPFSLDSYTQELVLGVMEGGVDGGELFGDTKRNPTSYGHLANFFEVSDDSSFELDTTYLLGSSDHKHGSDVQALGLDGTYSNFITPGHKLKLQSEIYFQHRANGEVISTDGQSESVAQSPYGFYTLADYRLAERWAAGVRFDYVEPTTSSSDFSNTRDYEKAYAGYLTFFESEFARWRLQYQRAQLQDGGEDNRFFLQGTFAIGAHKHNLN